MSEAVPGAGKYGGGADKSGGPPILAEYASGPRYDLATIVQLVGVRPMILWGWEQHLGIPTPTRISDDVGAIRRYSERDLIASIWLRDQILNGVSPVEAAARLRAAQRSTVSEDEWNTPEGNSYTGENRPRVNTGPLPDSPFSVQRAPKPTRPLSDLDTFFDRPGVSQSRPLPPQGPATTGGSDFSHGPSASQVWVSPLSGPLGQHVVSGPLGTPITSGPLGSSITPDHVRIPASAIPYSAQSGARAAGGAAPAPARSRDLRALVPQLIRAFVNLDTQTANEIMAEALATRPIEPVGINLLQPALTRVADLWTRHDITTPEEHFALNYVRGVLYGFFKDMRENPAGPLVFVGCAPRELNDVNPLMLAVYWRRVGMRVVYLGQDVEGESLVDEARLRRPALICLSASSTQRIRALARIGKSVAQLDKPRPTFVFSGPIFVRNPELCHKVTGIYLGDDAVTATWHATTLLGMDLR